MDVRRVKGDVMLHGKLAYYAAPKVQSNFR